MTEYAVGASNTIKRDGKPLSQVDVVSLLTEFDERVKKLEERNRSLDEELQEEYEEIQRLCLIISKDKSEINQLKDTIKEFTEIVEKERELNSLLWKLYNWREL